MRHTKTFFVLRVLALLRMIGLQATATETEPGNTGKVEADSNEQVAKQRNMLVASNHSITRHKLIQGEATLADAATNRVIINTR